MLFCGRYLIVALLGLISSAQDNNLEDVVNSFENAKV